MDEATNSPDMLLQLGSEEDRISDLPQAILHHILSFLDLNKAIQTSVLSTRWRHVWTTLPILQFHSNLFGSHKDGKAKAFKEFVDHVLFLRDSFTNIQVFCLDCYDLANYDDVTSRIYTWILTALRRNVQELWLNISVVDEGFRLPNNVFTCKSLVKLRVDTPLNSAFILDISPPDSMSLPRLEDLYLSNVWIEGDGILNKIFSSCPVLKSLTLSHCAFGQTNLNITAPHLTHLVIEKWYYHMDVKKGCSIKLYAPNLISFRCEDYMENEYYIQKNLSALVYAEIQVVVTKSQDNGVPKLDNETRNTCEKWMMKLLAALHNVEALALSAWFIQVVSGVPDSLVRTTKQFCNLRSLKLGAWLSRECSIAILNLLEIFPNIESLHLEIHKLDTQNTESTLTTLCQYFDELVFGEKLESYETVKAPLQYMLQHLKIAEIRGVEGCVNELHILEYLLKHAPVLEKMSLFTSREDSTCDREKQLIKFTKKLLNLPRASSTIAFLLF